MGVLAQFLLKFLVQCSTHNGAFWHTYMSTLSCVGKESSPRFPIYLLLLLPENSLWKSSLWVNYDMFSIISDDISKLEAMLMLD